MNPNTWQALLVVGYVAGVIIVCCLVAAVASAYIERHRKRQVDRAEFERLVLLDDRERRDEW